MAISPSAACRHDHRRWRDRQRHLRALDLETALTVSTSAAASLTISGSVYGLAGALTTYGSGTLFLTGSDQGVTYSTNVRSGTLAIDGSWLTLLLNVTGSRRTSRAAGNWRAAARSP